jgi:hypothetical protein
MRSSCYITILLLSLSGCGNRRESVTCFKINGFVLADTGRLANAFLGGSGHAGYPIYYIGPLKDSIGISRQYLIKRPPVQTWDPGPVSRDYSHGNLTIVVDTVAKTNAPMEYMQESGQILEDSTIHYRAYVFTNQNKSHAVLYMGCMYDVFYIAREVKNSRGQWVRVKKTLSEAGLCTFSRARIFLRPKEIIISKTRRHSGRYIVETRLAFGYDGNTAYSNVYLDRADGKY